MTGDEDDRFEGQHPHSWADHEDAPLETERLALADEDERLPWLESAEEDDEPASDTGRTLGLAALGLVALAALVGGTWWATHRGPDTNKVADGSVIAAPKQPYKEAPKNPGGKTFDGTGDTSFAVSEGQSRPAKMGDGSATAAASPVAPPKSEPGKPEPSKAAAAPAPAPVPASGGVGVQVGAFSSKAAAEAGWSKLAGQSNGVLSGVSHRVIEGSADIGKVYRLQAVAGDSGAANALCGKLKSAGISCQVK